MLAPEPLGDPMPRDGAIIFADLVGKLEVLRVACDKCGRDGSYRLAGLIDKRGGNGGVQGAVDSVNKSPPPPKGKGDGPGPLVRPHTALAVPLKEGARYPRLRSRRMSANVPKQKLAENLFDSGHLKAHQIPHYYSVLVIPG